MALQELSCLDIKSVDITVIDSLQKYLSSHHWQIMKLHNAENAMGKFARLECLVCHAGTTIFLDEGILGTLKVENQ
jgi:hypothetical protein